MYLAFRGAQRMPQRRWQLGAWSAQHQLAQHLDILQGTAVLESNCELASLTISIVIAKWQEMKTSRHRLCENRAPPAQNSTFTLANRRVWKVC